MKTIERYVFGSFLSSFLLAFLVLSFVLTIGLMVQIVGYILQGVPMGLVGEFALVAFPETMQWTIPIGLLVSSILVFSRLSADSEVAAMRACGINLLTVMRWPMIFAMLCTSFGLYINNEIVPRGHEIRRGLVKRISVGTGLDLLEPGQVIDDFPNAKLYFESRGITPEEAAEGAAEEPNRLNGLVVIDYSDKDVERNITAEKAYVSSEGRDIVLDLYNMTVDPIDDSHQGLARAKRFQYRVKDALKDSKYRRKEKDFHFFELIALVKSARKDARNAKLLKAETQEDAAAVKRRVKMARRYASDVFTEFMKRLVFAFGSICFVLVGVPLGIRAQRKESSIGMAISLVVALGYYLVVILMTSFSKNYALHPECLIWLPVVVCFLLASYLIPKNL